MKILRLPAVPLMALLILFCSVNVSAQEHKPVKNVIVMIPDGMSVPVLSLSRWYQWYLQDGQERLAVDPYFCGLVKTHSSNAPIGDSAPTTSTYMTGYYSITGYVSTYPKNSANDIYPVDADREMQPLTTIAEAARIAQGKSIGVVATVEFPHATPADVTAHYYQRSNYGAIAKQMAHNGIDLVIAGGTKILTEENKSHLEKQGTTVISGDLASFRKFRGNKLWALFGDTEQPYDIDRDTTKIPSLEEMTLKGMDVLSRNEKGFFLMVEGSKVDYAAHANDPLGMITEFLAFDKAVAAAIDFARKDGETLVLILPDHGNSGISIGNRSISSGYDKMPLSRLMDPLKSYKVTAKGMADILNQSSPDEVFTLFKKHLGIEITENELESIYKTSDYVKSPLPKDKRGSQKLHYRIAEIMTSKTVIGFTTNGHTGEDVFMAAYHPYGNEPRGLLDGPGVNHYICAEMGLSGILDSLTDANFVKHSEVFEGLEYSIEGEGILTTLVVKKGRKVLTATANSRNVVFDKKEIPMESLMVYMEGNKTFYLPKKLRALFD